MNPEHVTIRSEDLVGLARLALGKSDDVPLLILMISRRLRNAYPEVSKRLREELYDSGYRMNPLRSEKAVAK